MIDFSKLRIHSTLIHRHQALGQDKTWFDYMSANVNPPAKKRKKPKKNPRESWSHISNQDAVLHVPWPPFPSFFFSHHFSIGFFSCLQLWSSFYSSSFWELKRLSIGLATRLSIHDYQLNIVWNPIWFSLSL